MLDRICLFSSKASVFVWQQNNTKAVLSVTESILTCVLDISHVLQQSENNRPCSGKEGPCLNCKNNQAKFGLSFKGGRSATFSTFFGAAAPQHKHTHTGPVSWRADDSCRDLLYSERSRTSNPPKTAAQILEEQQSL